MTRTHKTEILYIHGFASSGDSNKAAILRDYFGEQYEVHSPTLPKNPELAIHKLNIIIQRILESKSNLILIGSSLGGFYADYFNRKYNIAAVLINPLVDIYDMVHFLGENINHSTGKTFVFKEYDMLFLETVDKEKKTMPYQDAFEIILLAEDDEVLDYEKSIAYFTEPTHFIQTCEGGGHRFEYTDVIIEALQKLI